MTIEKLLKVNVNEHTEKKNNLTYLSWAWAWAEALKADPAATYVVEMFDVTTQSGFFEKRCYMEINGTAMVWVTVTLFGKPMTCQLPVMDNKNDSIPLAGKTIINKYNKEVRVECDSFAVNTAIMRCMTKALSLHGLGLYIYAGEDLPEKGPIIPAVEKVKLSEQRESVIIDVSEAIKERFEADDIVGAFEEYSGIVDGEEKIALWAKLPSNIRSALKKKGSE